MKLKETTLDQRLFAGVLSIIIFGYGMLMVMELGSKFEQYCNVHENPATIEGTIFAFYVVIATFGCGLGTLHLLSMLKFRK
ncbi:MAG: hypothetical protein ACAH83_03995 [Alphaproteobacteria bacterium]